MIRTVKRILHRLSAIWAWLPIVWSDDDWDDEHLINVLILKLERMYWSSMHWIEIEEYLGPKREAMLLALNALIRVRDDYWDNMAGEIHRERWGDPHHEREQLKHGCIRMTTTYPGHDTELAREHLLRLSRQAEYLTQHDVDKAMDALKGMRGWWD